MKLQGALQKQVTVSFARAAAWPVVVLGLASPLLTNCGAGGPKLPGNLPTGDLPGAGALSCPDFSTSAAVMNADLESAFKLDTEGAKKLKAGVAASVDIKTFSDGVEADLKTACAGLAKDLGATGDYGTADDACKAASKAMADVKAKLTAKAKIALDIKPPYCQASLDVASDCAVTCDATVKPGEAKVTCEPGKLSGQCSAECSGTCDMQAAAKCTGTCHGSCTAQMKGSCGGKCDGKCDGKASAGATCTGVCEGKCDANVHGECKGECGGSCELKAKAKCSGTCTGGCTAELKEPKCVGEVKPPEMSADCKAKCDAEVQAKATCTPASVGVRVTGSADAAAAVQYKAALEKNLPGVLKIAMGVGDRGVKTAGEVEAVVDGLQGSISSMVKADGAAAATTAAKLGQCVTAPFKAAIAGAANLKANVNVSVEVKASASASASGQAAGKAG